MSFQDETKYIQEIANTINLAIPGDGDCTRIDLVVNIAGGGTMGIPKQLRGPDRDDSPDPLGRRFRPTL